MKPRLLDLFCGAGGAAMGYHRAGFEVVGVDIKPQPRYPFEFQQADALSVLGSIANGTSALEGVVAIHASPPCQRYSAMKVMANARKDHPDLVGPVREHLQRIGLPYIIENVPGAPIEHLVRLCGTSFGLGVEVYDGWRQLLRHRYFETSFSMLTPPCQHEGSTIGLYGDHLRDRRRKGPNGKGLDFPDWMRVPYGGAAMGIDWMEWGELREAIPPAYTEFVGDALLDFLGQRDGNGGAVTGGEFASVHLASERAPDLPIVRGDLDGRQDRVSDFVGADIVAAVWKLDVQVDEDRAGHGSSFGTVTSGSITDLEAGFKGRDGDTFLPLPSLESCEVGESDL